MACSRGGKYQDPNGTTPITNITLSRIQSNNCRRKGATYPSFAPVIYNLSQIASISTVYSLVFIDGTTFLPPCYGNTFVNFGPYTNLPITFYSTFNISFVVPLNIPVGDYAVTVVNVYNGNFSPAINQSNPGILNYSNPITYHIS
jgi:hypothetical protein